MAGTTNRIPAALSDDAPDVIEALEVARALWETGERKDAIRWVRRAAEAAAEAGQTARLLTLAGGAADLEEASPSPVSVAAPVSAVPTPPRSVTPPPSRSVSVAPRSVTPAPSRSVAPPAARPVSAAPPLSAPPPRSVTPPASRAVVTRPPPPPRSVTPPARSVAPVASLPSTPPPLPSKRASKPASLPPVPHQPSSSVQLVRKVQEPDPTRVRVSVRVSARDATLLVVRPLSDGEAPPAGTREAFLVMAEPASGAALANGGVG